jgi:hypothetical protein
MRRCCERASQSRRTETNCDGRRSKAAARYDAIDYDDASSHHVMQTYYSHLFPFKQLFLWLNQDHTPTRNWTHREFAFTLRNDAYLRYNSFSTGEDMKKEVLRLTPARFEIGPVYSGRVRFLGTASLKLIVQSAQGQKDAEQGHLQAASERARL